MPASAFYSPFLSEKLDMQQDYVSWAQYGPAERGVPLSVPWSFCSEPWLFNAGAKVWRGLTLRPNPDSNQP